MVKGILASGGLVVVTVVAGAVLSSSVVLADDSAVTTTSITVPSSCTMVGTTDSAHTGSVPNGIYSGGSDYYPDGIGQTTLKVYCNDVAGFSIYAIGYTGEQYSGTNHTKLIGSSTNEAIATGTAESGPTSNWAMKLATNAQATYPITLENGYGSFSAIPDTYTKVATRSGSTDVGDIATGASLTTTYAAYISPTQLADTYTGKVKYTMVHPASATPLQPQTTEPGYIAYYPNASTAVGSMSDSQGGPVQQLTASQTEATLLAPNFSRDGYGFAGWSDAFDWATNANANFYGPNQDIAFTAGQYSGTNNGLSLYAVWVKSAGTFQSNASTVCSSLTAAPATGTPTMASVSALTDERDNQTYTIAKLADGNCWMIENLRLEAENTRSAEDEALAQGYGKYSGTGTDYGDFIGLADAESANFSNSTTANSFYYSGTQSGSATENIGSGDYPGYRFPRYNHINTDSTSASPTRATSLTKSTTYLTTAGANIYGYGNYYTWPAAIADTSYYNTNNQIIENTSLCPKGWRLPGGGNKTNIELNKNDFYVLTLAITGAIPNNYDSSDFPDWSNSSPEDTEGTDALKAIRSYPNNFLFSGWFQDSSPTYRARSGIYWSSTVSRSNGSSVAYRLNFQSNADVVQPSTSGTKSRGGSVRCLADT